MAKRAFLQALKGSAVSAGTAGTAAILAGYAEDKVDVLKSHRWILPTTAIAAGTFLHSRGKAEDIANGLVGFGGVYLLLQAYATLQKQEQTKSFPPLFKTSTTGDDLGSFEDGTGALVGTGWDAGALLPAEGWGDAGYADGYGDTGALVGGGDNAEGIENNNYGY